jgi:hypothetical protein
MLKLHVRLGRQADASAHNVLQGRSLLCQSVHNRCSIGDQRRFEHVAQQGENRMEVLVVRVLLPFVLDSSEEFRNQNEINDQRRR